MSFRCSCSPAVLSPHPLARRKRPITQRSPTFTLVPFPLLRILRLRNRKRLANVTLFCVHSTEWKQSKLYKQPLVSVGLFNDILYSASSVILNSVYNIFCPKLMRRLDTKYTNKKKLEQNGVLFKNALHHSKMYLYIYIPC